MPKTASLDFVEKLLTRGLHGAQLRGVRAYRATEQCFDDGGARRQNLRVKVRRNDPCPCGSGKKYKRCHIRAKRDGSSTDIVTRQYAAPRLVGQFLGKPVLVRPEAPRATIEDLKRHLSRFNLACLLRMIGGACADLSSDAHRDLGGAIASQHALRYIGQVAIESASDTSTVIPRREDIVEAVRLFDGLPDMTPSIESDGVLEYLIRMAYAQFGGRDDFHNLIARTWLIYERIWPHVDKAKQFDVASAIRDETGLTLRQLLFFGLAYLANIIRRNDGYFAPYSDEALRGLPSPLAVGVPEHQAFLNLVTATYEEVRGLARSFHHDGVLDQYTLSPFLLKPVVRPDSPPVGAEGVLLVPVPQFLALRVTQGIYHMLATTSNAGAGENAFRVAFGHALESYVGELLRAGSGRCQVLAEIEYGARRAVKKSPDWLVLDGPRLVAIEVKQSALTLNSKSVGDLRRLSEDLRKTLIKAAAQLVAFQSALRASERGLEKLSGVTDVQLVIVTHDDLAWPNWILRDRVTKEVPGAEQIHFCTVGDLENLQRYCWGLSPFDLLLSKARGRAAEFDFREWLAELGDPGRAHPLLEGLFGELTTSWGLKAPAE